MPKSAYLVLNIFHYFVFNLFLGPSNAFEVEETQKTTTVDTKLLLMSIKKTKKERKFPKNSKKCFACSKRKAKTMVGVSTSSSLNAKNLRNLSHRNQKIRLMPAF